ncbi:MAG TPA: CapA family protein [Ktedonobacterales bacterium]|nr:CapA family protein [Ktedonobacterales bacterium]
MKGEGQRRETSDTGDTSHRPASTKQSQAGGPILTRRELLAAGAAATATVALAACAPGVAQKPAATATPFALKRPAVLYADGTVPKAVANSVAANLGGHAGISDTHLATSVATSPDLVLTYGALPQGYKGAAIGASPATAIAHMRVPIDGVSGDQARGLLSGSVANWQAAGAPYSLPVKVFTLKGLTPPKGVTISGGATTVATADDLLQQVKTHPGSIALAPAELADWRVKNLGIANIYPAQQRGSQLPAPFAPFTLQLGVADALAKQGLDVKALAGALAFVLAGATPVMDMVAVGDIMLGRGVNNKMVAYNDYLYPFRKMKEELDSADLRVANLECTVTDKFPIPTDNATFTFVTKSKAISGLTYAGFDMLTVANNHANGPGYTPFMDMVSNLRNNGISICGGGNTLKDARTPATATAKGLRVAMHGYCGTPPGAQGPFATESSWGLAPVDLGTLPQDIVAARANADLVIPYFHWGIEYTKDPIKMQQNAARAAIDAGADMVLGVHPHWVQAIEEYKGKLIIYALGNFVFDQDWSRPTLEGFLLHLYWRGSTLVSARWVPTLDQDRCQPRVMTSAEAVGVFQRMWSGTDMLASGEYGLA